MATYVRKTVFDLISRSFVNLFKCLYVYVCFFPCLFSGRNLRLEGINSCSFLIFSLFCMLIFFCVLSRLGLRVGHEM